MIIYLATDHAGYALKEAVKNALLAEGETIEDKGALTYNPGDDYPDYISLAAEAVSKDPDNSRGIVFGGSGQAEMIVANKFKEVRCGLFYTKALPVHPVDVDGRMSTDPYEMIRLTREHNNANMLSIGARFITDEEAITVVKMWLKQAFPADERHVRRIKEIQDIEARQHG